jgi:hypothetical protein
VIRSSDDHIIIQMRSPSTRTLAQISGHRGFCRWRSCSLARRSAASHFVLLVHASPPCAMQSLIWASTIPLYITHPSSTIPYVIHAPRLSYLPLLLPRLTSFFGPASSFSHEGILLKNLPIGLLYDLYRPELPWRLELGDGPLFDVHDTFMNSVKEVWWSALS